MNFKRLNVQVFGLGIVAVTVVACSKSGEVNRATAPQTPVVQTQSVSDTGGDVSPLNQVVAITKDSELAVLSDENSTDTTNTTKMLKLSVGTEVTVIRKAQLPEVGEVAEIRIDSDDESVPSEAFVRMSDLEAISMSTDQGLTPLDAALSEGDDEDVLIENAARGRRGTPSCYRDVKFELLRRGLVRRYPSGAAAWMGYDVLRGSHGFRPVAFSQSLPNGAVCVSEGGRFSCGRKKCGHIAVKIGSQRWYGAGVFKHPLLRNHYNLRCLVK